MSDDVSDTPGLSGGGGGPQLVPSKVMVGWFEETMAGDTPGQEFPCEDLGMRPLIGTKKPSCGTVSEDAAREGGAAPFRCCREVSSG